MNEVRDTAIVLRATNYKEKDLILSLLTKNNGRLSTCARGVRGGSKRFSGGIDLFDCADIIIKKNNLESLTRVETWPNFCKKPSLFTNASTCLETIIALTDEQDSESKDLFLTLFLTLRALNRATSEDEQNSILVFFMRKTLETTGFGVTPISNQETQQWLKAIDTQPIIPTNRTIIEPTKKLLISQIENIVNKKIFSAHAV